jgi:2-phospho-L-lactate guanylyltransferase
MPAPLRLGPTAVLVPVKAFAEAKRRLAPALAPAERTALARRMADHVLTTAPPLPVAVVCDDEEVAAWARDRHALVVWAADQGLNGAVEIGIAALARLGVERAIVAHADLPFAGPLEWVAGFGGITLVPDARDDGTNVACIPTTSGFRFGYGPGSFDRHRAEAHRLGLALRIVREPALGRDIDVPSDLAALGVLTA